MKGTKKKSKLKKALIIIFSVIVGLFLALVIAALVIPEPSGVTGEANGEKMQTVLEPAEYVLYENIFYNDRGADYINRPVEKTGIFTKITDAFNSMERYYVWGYNDNTKCCDWQWEFVPSDLNELPPVGSTVKVVGNFVAEEKALDNYWIENATVETISEYKNSKVDLDLTTMGGTLERVQVINMQRFNEVFEGKTVAAYGRVETPNSIQHPYYDNAFSLNFKSNDSIEAFGTVVIVSGTFENGIVNSASVQITHDY